MPWVVNIFCTFLVRFCFVNIKQQSIRLKKTKSIFESTTYSAQDIRFHSKRRNIWAATCSGSSLSKIIFARYLYAGKGNGFLPSIAARPSCLLSFTASLLVPFFYDKSCVHSFLLVFSLSIPNSRLRWVSLKRKLRSWVIGDLHTHSYIYMFLDIYNCRIRLGIKLHFRCKVLKYAKPCAEKYPH